MTKFLFLSIYISPIYVFNPLFFPKFFSHILSCSYDISNEFFIGTSNLAQMQQLSYYLKLHLPFSDDSILKNESL